VKSYLDYGAFTPIQVAAAAALNGPQDCVDEIRAIRFLLDDERARGPFNLIAPEYQLTPQLVLAVMSTESNFDPWAVSPKKAQGLMQLMPDTATRFKVGRIEDPVQNIRGGMAYLRWLLAYFEGDLTLVLAAYNAGERAVERYQGVPPYAETRHYVQRVLATFGGPRSHPFDPAVTPPSGVLRAPRDSARPRS